MIDNGHVRPTTLRPRFRLFERGYFGVMLVAFGYGVVVIDRRMHAPLFSVRNGYTQEWRVGRWGIGFIVRGERMRGPKGRK